MAAKDYTKERIALFTRYFLSGGKPVTVKELINMFERYSGERVKRQTIYDGLNAIDIAIGLRRDCCGLSSEDPGYHAGRRSYRWSLGVIDDES